MNMRSVCFCFQVHQPYKLRTYRYFEIGKRHQYYDDYFNRITMQRVAEHCYLPMNNLMLKKINQLGERFNFSISFSGIGLELMQSFKEQRPISREQLTYEVDTSYRNINRVLKRLSELGIIDASKTVIKILNVEELQRIIKTEE